MIRSCRASDVSISSTSGVGALSIPTSTVGALSTDDLIGEGATAGILGALAAATGFSALPTGDSLEIGGLVNGVLSFLAAHSLWAAMVSLCI